MSGYPYPGPRAPENNPTIEPEFFQPSVFSISNISYGVTTTVTTLPAFGVDNNYVIGQLVRLNIPKFYGANQLNGQQAYVIGLPATNQVTLQVNTSKGYDAFVPSPAYGPTPPQIAAIGEVNTGTINSSGRGGLGTSIPGAFINISTN